MRDMVTSRFGKISAMKLIRFRSRNAISVLQELGVHSQLDWDCIFIKNNCETYNTLFHAQIYVKICKMGICCIT